VRKKDRIYSLIISLSELSTELLLLFATLAFIQAGKQPKIIDLNLIQT
jgi:hypothetical protein